MVNGGVAVATNPPDLRFQRGNPRVEFGDRQRIEILTRQHRQRVVAPEGKILLGIHAAKR
ncbi:hypothetical protein DFR49_3686 [Hephaestia caeni]|uniref:Uncharacterized protein n=1 Tax=Hephaestia caeni TaxID=645617 RepID=A0A397NN28_9SPHN|nr:hypothetical protein DFR49_3686 [Hephaestia caeni]